MTIYPICAIIILVRNLKQKLTKKVGTIMTREMIKNELKEKVEIYNYISSRYTEYQNQYNMNDDYIESTLNELEKIITNLGALLDVYE